MKIILLTPVVILIAISCGQNDKSGKKETTEIGTKETSSKKEVGTKPAKTIFDIKLAKIVFNYTGGPETGTETLYFDDYGNTAVLLIDKKSKYSNNVQTVIWKDNQSIIINHERKAVSKSAFRPKSTEPPAIADTDEQTRKNIGYEKLADETIAGKTCEVWFNAKQKVKYWLWNKIEMKMEYQGSFTKEAATVEEISEIPESLMKIPEGYKQ